MASIFRYRDPGCRPPGFRSLGTAVIVAEPGRRTVLLHRRADDASWSLPGGLVELAESVEQCAVRELREETGVVATIDRIAGLHSSTDLIIDRGGDRVSQPCIVVFEATAVGGCLRCTDETTEVGYFPVTQLPAGTLPHIRNIIESWVRCGTSQFFL